MRKHVQTDRKVGVLRCIASEGMMEMIRAVVTGFEIRSGEQPECVVCHRRVGSERAGAQ